MWPAMNANGARLDVLQNQIAQIARGMEKPVSIHRRCIVSLRFKGQDFSAVRPWSSSIWSLLMRPRQLQRNEAYLAKVRKAWQRHVPGISLEQAVSGIDDPTPTTGARAGDTAVPHGVRSIIHEEPSLATSDSTTSPAEQRNAEDYEFDESEDLNEAIDGMGFLTLESQKSGYTGPQSGIAAMCFLRSLPNDLELVQDVEPSAYPADSIPSHESSPNEVNIDETVNDYFALFHPAYPLLHEGLFRAQMAGGSKSLIRDGVRLLKILQVPHPSHVMALGRCSIIWSLR